MNILVIGDVYSKSGRDMISEYLDRIRIDYKIDFVIANGENISHGRSITKKHYEFLKDNGVDVITGGNHTFDKTEVVELLEKEVVDVLRPANSNPYHQGKGSYIFIVNNKKIRITNLLGSAFMKPCDNLFYVMDQILEIDDSDIHLVDLHAEATAEKIAFAWNYDARITALWGTHTHVQTNDARILPKGTGFISDVGMTGPYYSIIGANPTEVIALQKYQLPQRLTPAKGLGQFNAIVISIDDISNKVISINTININPERPYSKVN